jgi:hypothetical protein
MGVTEIMPGNPRHPRHTGYPGSTGDPGEPELRRCRGTTLKSPERLVQ